MSATKRSAAGSCTSGTPYSAWSSGAARVRISADSATAQGSSAQPLQQMRRRLRTEHLSAAVLGIGSFASQDGNTLVWQHAKQLQIKLTTEASKNHPHISWHAQCNEGGLKAMLFQ